MTGPGPTPELVAWATRVTLRHDDLMQLASGQGWEKLHARRTWRGGGGPGYWFSCNSKHVDVENSPAGAGRVPWRLIAEHAHRGITPATYELLCAAGEAWGAHCHRWERWTPGNPIRMRDGDREKRDASRRAAVELIEAAEVAVFDAADLTLPAIEPEPEPEPQQLTLFGATA